MSGISTLGATDERHHRFIQVDEAVLIVIPEQARQRFCHITIYSSDSYLLTAIEKYICREEKTLGNLYWPPLMW